MARATEAKPATAPDQVTLALERTYLAHERTLMAWTRTATSLITFGFTLFKFFEYLHERGEAGGQRALGARTFGLIMIGIGVFTLVLATVQHRLQMREQATIGPADAPDARCGGRGLISRARRREP